MKDSSDCPKLCRNCPIKPDGVRAELTDLVPATEQERLRFGYPLAPRRPQERQFDRKPSIEFLRATFTIIASTRPDIAVGNKVIGLVRTYGQTEDEVRKRFENCRLPVNKPGDLLAALGITANCGGMVAPS